jgi:hypothetical protein
MITNTGKTAPPTSSEWGAMKSTQVAIGKGSLRNPSKLQSASPSPTVIAEKAHEIWLAQGQEPGRDQEHWFEAERQLRHG